MNKLLKESKDTSDNIVDQVVKGAGERLRPILLTTVTTVAGLIPTVYGIGGSNPMIKPLTMALAYGLVFGTTITLILIPSLYMIDRDIRRGVKRMRDFFKRKVKGEAASAQ